MYYYYYFFFVMLYSSFVLNTLKKFSRAATDRKTINLVEVSSSLSLGEIDSILVLLSNNVKDIIKNFIKVLHIDISNL